MGQTISHDWDSGPSMTRDEQRVGVSCDVDPAIPCGDVRLVPRLWSLLVHLRPLRDALSDQNDQNDLVLLIGLDPQSGRSALSEQGDDRRIRLLASPLRSVGQSNL